MKKKIILAALLMGAALLAGCGHDTPIQAEKAVTVDYGETLWDICKREAGDSVDVRRVIYDTAEKNGIPQNAVIQPGQKIVVVIRG